MLPAVVRAAVIGSGSWGTALAKVLGERGHSTTLWARHEETARQIARTRENAVYLPGFALPADVRPTADLGEALEDAEIVLFVVPSHGLRAVAKQASRLLSPDVPVVTATKGIENETLATMTEVLAAELDNSRRLAALGGPSFAREVAAGQPTAVTVAARDEDLARRVQQAISSERFRAYTTDDVMGVELGGALKNVIAIAAGVADGLGLGHNTRAAIITRGLAEIARLAMRRGANPLTLAGLAGVGDLVLTCTGDLSRNRAVGIELGRGAKVEQVLGGMKMVAEGVRTAKSARDLAAQMEVEIPIAEAVAAILYDGVSVRDAITELLGRALKSERG